MPQTPLITEIAVFINTAALVCILLALPLFIGTRCNSIVDKNNLVGILLIGFALFLNGGLESFLRSSPRAVFSGYVLGWSGGTDAKESSLWIYDLGFPPKATSWARESPFRNLFVVRSAGNPVPVNFWNAQTDLLMRCEYRLWDRRITRIEAVPVSDAKQVPWQWQSEREGHLWRALETFFGLFLFCGCVLLLRGRKTAGEKLSVQGRPNATRAFPNKWAVRIYVFTLGLLVTWFAFVRLSDRLFQYNAEVLLREIQKLELQKSSWQDAERIRSEYARYVTLEAPCSVARCDFSVNLDHWWNFLRVSPGSDSLAGRILWTARRLAGGRWAYVAATIRVRDGTIWGKDFSVTVSHREGYPLIADATTVRGFPARRWYKLSQRRANVAFGKPGGCGLCQKLWVKVTPYASQNDMRDAFAFDLSCIGDTLRACTDVSAVLPTAAHQLEEDIKLSGSEEQESLARTPALLRRLGRDARKIAVVEVVGADFNRLGETGRTVKHADCRVLEILKGKFQDRVHLEYPEAVDRLPDVNQHVIAFWADEASLPLTAPATPENLAEVRKGVVEDAVDIPPDREK